MVKDIMTSISIFYYPYQNIFKDCNGKIIINLHKLVSPNRVFLFKKNKKNEEFVNHEYGINIRLYYPKNVLTDEGWVKVE